MPHESHPRLPVPPSQLISSTRYEVTPSLEIREQQNTVPQMLHDARPLLPLQPTQVDFSTKSGAMLGPKLRLQQDDVPTQRMPGVSRPAYPSWSRAIGSHSQDPQFDLGRPSTDSSAWRKPDDEYEEDDSEEDGDPNSFPQFSNLELSQQSRNVIQQSPFPAAREREPNDVNGTSKDVKADEDLKTPALARVDPDPGTAKTPVVSRNPGINVLLLCAGTIFAVVLGVLVVPLHSSLFSTPGAGILLPVHSFPSLDSTVAHRHAWQLELSKLEAPVASLSEAKGLVNISRACRKESLLPPTSVQSAIESIRKLSAGVKRAWTDQQGHTLEKEEPFTLTTAIRRPELGARQPNWRNVVHGHAVSVALFWRKWLKARLSSPEMAIWTQYLPTGIHHTLLPRLDHFIASYPPIAWARDIRHAIAELGSQLDRCSCSSNPVTSVVRPCRLLQIPATLRRLQGIHDEARRLTRLSRCDSDDAGLRCVTASAKDLMEMTRTARSELQAWTEGWLHLLLGGSGKESLREMLEGGDVADEVLWQLWAAGRDSRQELLVWMARVEDVIWAGVDAIQG
ncbi:Hypothetical predicted protein [Lecanosticta acicola]|uniref:Uncharacterized protein n=1 Tax=Lecanosticta acicola TaxID=111012 RepID=A0AAI8Z7W1_9PEZI|nr:Hypothetical predicted protein [Lecanosticta acicola]